LGKLEIFLTENVAMTTESDEDPKLTAMSHG
jgi:hypothetical protein